MEQKVIDKVSKWMKSNRIGSDAGEWVVKIGRIRDCNVNPPFSTKLNLSELVTLNFHEDEFKLDDSPRPVEHLQSFNQNMLLRPNEIIAWHFRPGEVNTEATFSPRIQVFTSDGDYFATVWDGASRSRY